MAEKYGHVIYFLCAMPWSSVNLLGLNYDVRIPYVHGLEVIYG